MATKTKKRPARKRSTAEWRYRRYHSDAKYRKKVQAAARERARVSLKEARKESDCRDNLSKLSRMGTPRAISTAGGPVVLNTFSLDEAADALYYSPSGLRKMIARGVIPKPILSARVEVTAAARARAYNLQVYTEAEVRAMIDVIGHHYVEVGRLLDVHKTAIRALTSAVRAARKAEDFEPLR
jgi:hypothetical protein